MGNTDPTERLGIFAVGLAAEQAGWVFREQPRPDQGIDAMLEGRTNGTPDGRLMALQIKSGVSRFDEPTPGGWRFYVEESHISYWSRHPIPVLLVLYNPATEIAYWQHVNPATTRRTEKQFVVYVPTMNVFDERARSDLERIIEEFVPNENGDGELRDRTIASDLPWMWMLREKKPLFLEVEQGLGDRDGRWTLRLTTSHGQDSTTVRAWPRAFVPGGDLAAELAQLFPWADKTIDRPRYREHAAAQFVAECGRWNGKEQDYDWDADFDDWFEARFGQGPKPYGVTSDGTTALWRFELRLNSVGEAALEQDEKDMEEDALLSWHLDQENEHSPGDGYYAIEMFDHTYSRYGWLENLAFVFGEEIEDRESLLFEPRLLARDGSLLPATAAAILEHASGEPATESLVRAFADRFEDEFVGEDGLWALEGEKLVDWLAEVGCIAKFGTES